MNRLMTWGLTIALPGVLAFGVLAYTAERTQQSTVRKAPRTIQRGGPIAERLTPDDSDVTVLSGKWRGLSVGPGQGRSLIAFWLDLGATAVVAQLRKGQARLTAAGDFVETDWVALVQEPLRIGSGHPFAGQGEIRFTIETGDLQIGRTSVHARVGWARQFVSGAKYLLFVDWDQKRTTPMLSQGRAYRILDDGTLERVDLLQNEISKLTLAEAISQIKAWVRAKGDSEASLR